MTLYSGLFCVLMSIFYISSRSVSLTCESSNRMWTENWGGLHLTGLGGFWSSCWWSKYSRIFSKNVHLLFKWWYFRLESQCVTAISFVKNEPELLDRWQLFLIEKELVALKLTIMPPLCNILQPDYFFSPIWVIIINIVALEMLKAKLPQCKWSRDWFPKSPNPSMMTNHD